MRVVELSAANTHDLRRRVLRVGTVTTSVDFDGDDGAVHLGVMVDSDVVAVSSWFDRRHPDRPGVVGRQLRGMAVEPSLAGAGLGSLLLSAGLERMRSDGAGLVWARAWEHSKFQHPTLVPMVPASFWLFWMRLLP